MGCGLSSSSKHCPSVAEHERGSNFQAASAAESPTATRHEYSQQFHPFRRLPYELRRQIWIECLSQETPRAYSLELEITLGVQYALLFDVDFAPARPLRDGEDIRHLITATAASRIVGSTCREARDAVLFVLPDKFQMKANPHPWPESVQLPHLSTGYFRFNAKQDIIIVLFSSPYQLESVLEWSSRGGMLESLQTIQHLALDTTFLEDALLPKIWNRCHCGEPGCGSCSMDPLPNFLRLFHRLKSFHIAQATPLFLGDERFSEEVVDPVKPCNCDNTTQGKIHDWPVIKGMGHDAWYISYKEDSDCPFPPLPQLEYDRRLSGGSRWPYYAALTSLDMRILRRVTLPDK